jgi:vacuolar-type H+-ATPase catalytic subunit A/Vma1
VSKEELDYRLGHPGAEYVRDLEIDRDRLARENERLRLALTELEEYLLIQWDDEIGAAYCRQALAAPGEGQ